VLSPRAIETLLIASLDDTEGLRVSGSMDGCRFNNPRACDFAAHYLSIAFAGHLTFDLEAAESERNQQIEGIKEALAETRGVGVPGRR
jgi:hypothetical protein